MHMAAALETGRERRRSTRVLVSIPILLSGVTDEGQPFQALGETVAVNKHGAKIRTEQPLGVGMQVSVEVTTTRKEQSARVVWVGESEEGATAEVQFAMELERPENIWGIYFPPEDWREPEAWPEEAEPTPAAVRAESPREPRGEMLAPAAQPPAAPACARPAPATAATSGAPSEALAIPAEGIEVYIRGMSAARMPFQERAFLCPEDEREATVLVRPVVDLGITVQVVFPHANRSLKARTSAVSAQRHEGKWKMWLQFLEPVLVASN